MTSTPDPTQRGPSAVAVGAQPAPPQAPPQPPSRDDGEALLLAGAGLARLRRAATTAELRMRLQRALDLGTTALVIAAWLAAVTWAAAKTAHLADPTARRLLIACAVVPLLAGVVGWLRRLPQWAGAVALDRQANLHGRTASALAFAHEHPKDLTPLQEAAIADGVAQLARLSPRRAVPLRLPQDTAAALLMATFVVGVGLLEVYRLPSSNVPGDLTNLSLRARTGPGEQVAIAGFVLVDPQNFDRSTRILVRAIGPALASYGISSPLADPILTVYNASGQVVAQNDNWSDVFGVSDLTAAAQSVGAFALSAGSKDSALLLDLPPGSYTAQITSPNNASGVTLIEVYLVR